MLPPNFESRWDTSDQGILKLVEDGENERVEFKQRLPPENILARTLAAFANTQGGILLIGVDDSGIIVGVPPEQGKLALHRLSRMGVSLGLSEMRTGVTNVDNKGIVYVVAPRAPRHLLPVTTAEGEVFIRQAAADVRADLQREIELASIPTTAPDKTGTLRIFVAMSFRTEEDPHLVDYKRAMVRSAERVGNIELKTIDLEEGDYEISQRIMDEIDGSDAVLADFTLSSRNVYFELGYARGRRKPVIQSARNETVLEFDIRNWRTIFYRNATELEEKLLSAFRALHK